MKVDKKTWDIMRSWMIKEMKDKYEKRKKLQEKLGDFIDV